MLHTFLYLSLLILTTSFTIPRYTDDLHPREAHRGERLDVYSPQAPLAPGSLQVISNTNRQKFCDWTAKEHFEARSLIERIVKVWKIQKIASQYLVYGKTTLHDPAERFYWEVVPFPDQGWDLWKQVKVMWNIAFGPAQRSSKTLDRDNIRSLLGDFSNPPANPKNGIEKCAENDPFCDPKVLAKQTVYEGAHVYVLYDYSAFRIQNDRPHFLILPKRHAVTFTDLTEEESLEAMELAQLISCYFHREQFASTVYLYHKNGPRAGQSVPHWHLHLVVVPETRDEICADGNRVKSRVRSTGLTAPFQQVAKETRGLYNNSLNFLSLLFPRYYLDEEELKQNVGKYRKAFAKLKVDYGSRENIR